MGFGRACLYGCARYFVLVECWMDSKNHASQLHQAASTLQAMQMESPIQSQGPHQIRALTAQLDSTASYNQKNMA